MAYWLFQANTTYFDLQRALSELGKITWKVSRFAKEIAPGNHVVLWLSGKDAGVYALGRIDTLFVANRNRPNSAYWLYQHDWSFVGKTHAIVLIDHVLQRPLLKRDIINDSTLKDLAVIRAPIGTNFRLTKDEWDRIIELTASPLGSPSR